jgi:hypothetical protein
MYNRARSRERKEHRDVAVIVLTSACPYPSSARGAGSQRSTLTSGAGAFALRYVESKIRSGPCWPADPPPHLQPR